MKNFNSNPYIYFTFLIVFIAYLPVIVSSFYSIDDYYLYSLADINSSTLGYNFYSTGRFAQLFFADIFSLFNLQPITRPLGPILFIFSLVYLGKFICSHFNIKKNILYITFICIFCINPFLYEIFSYSIVSIYSAFSIFFITLALKKYLIYLETKKYRHIFLAIIYINLSLFTYQIFLPILVTFLLIKIYIDFSSKKPLHILNHIAFIFLSSLIYYLIIKISFYIVPPNMAYFTSTDLGSFKDVFSINNFLTVAEKNLKFIFLDNPYNSKISNILLISLSFLSLLFSKKVFYLKVIDIAVFIFFIAYFIFFISGFSIFNINLISARFFSAFSFFQFFFVYLLFTNSFYFFSTDQHKKFLKLVMILLLFVNTALVNKLSLDQFRMNSLDKQFINRLVSRLESFDQFNSNATLLIYGHFNFESTSINPKYPKNTISINSFSKVFAINEVSGYNFKNPSPNVLSDNENISKQLKAWPDKNSIIYLDNNLFLIRLN